MDNILLAHKNKEVLLETYGQLQLRLVHAELVIAQEKVQMPFKYLGHMLYPKEIKLQKLKIRENKLQTLNGFQKLLGDTQ